MINVCFPFSIGKVEHLRHERGIDICLETVRFWRKGFGLLFAAKIGKRRVSGMRSSHRRQNLDEDFAKINAKQRFSQRPVHHEGPGGRKHVGQVSELEVLDGLHRRRRVFVSGRDLVHQGQTDSSAYILADGWVCSYKLMPNGERQIVDFQIPGDFLGLRSVLFRTANHNIEPVTPVEASEVLQSDLLRAFETTPRLATAVLWAASRDEAMVVEHLVSIGPRDAKVRTAHFLLELGARLILVGRGTRDSFACPLTQYHLVDALGLSAVHVNRTLRELREDGLLTFKVGLVTIHDFDRLVDLAEFDRSYLDQEGPLLR